MQITTSDPTSPPGALLAPIHQYHRGLTTVVVRRRGSDTDLAHCVLHTKDGSPVPHGEAPSDSPEEITTRLWAIVRDDAGVKGPGTYDVTLQRAAAEKGTPPKAISIPLPVGHAPNGVGGETATAMYVAQFCASTLDRTLAQLPALVSAVGDALGALHQASSTLLDKQREQQEVPAELEIERIRAATEKARWDRLEKMLAGPLVDLRSRMRPRAPAPAVASTSASTSASASASTSASTPTQSPVIDTSARDTGDMPASGPESPDEEICRLARRSAERISADPSLRDTLRALLGSEIAAGIEAMRSGHDAGAVIDTLRLVMSHDRRIEALVILEGPIVDDLERISELSKFSQTVEPEA